MTDHEKRALIDRYLTAYNSFDIEAMMATLHREVEFENVTGGEVTAAAAGVSAFRRLAEQARSMFSERCQSVTSWTFSADGAQLEIAYEGVLATDVPNGPRRGDTLRIDGASEFEFKDGLIARIVDRS